MATRFRFINPKRKRRIEADKFQTDLIAAEVAISTVRRALETNSDVRNTMKSIIEQNYAEYPPTRHQLPANGYIRK